jgi:hypothetical protein
VVNDGAFGEKEKESSRQGTVRWRQGQKKSQSRWATFHPDRRARTTTSAWYEVSMFAKGGFSGCRIVP